MKTQAAFLKLFAVALSATILLSACGGGASSSADSQGSSTQAPAGSGSSSNGPGGSTGSAPNTSMINLVDPVHFPVSGVTVMRSMSTVTLASALADVSGWETLQICSGTLDPQDLNATPCLMENGQIWVPCANAPHQFAVYDNDEQLTTFTATCDLGVVDQIVPNRNFVLVYSVDSQTNEIVQHNLDLDALTLTVLNRLPTGQSPTKIIHHPTGNMIYVLDQADGDIATFHISGLTGAAEEVPPRLSTGSYPLDLVMNTQKTCLFVNNVGENSYGLSRFAIDQHGELAALAPVSFGTTAAPSALTLSDDGLHAYVATGFENRIRHYRVDPANCNMTLQDSILSGGLVASLAVNHSNSRLYVTYAYANLFASYAISEGVLVAGRTLIARNLEDPSVTCADGQCSGETVTDPGQILMIGAGDEGDVLSVFNGGVALKDFYVDNSGAFAYATRNTNHDVDVYLVGNDCSLTPYFSTVQGGDSLGIIVNMIPLDAQPCNKTLYSPEAATRAQAVSWVPVSE